MSKELAQTVGGKRVAWLLAILAAFAVVVTVAGNWRSSEAAVTTGSYEVVGPFTSEPTTIAQCDITNASYNPVSVNYGALVYYCIVSSGDATIANPLNITFDLPNTLRPGGIYTDDVGPVTSNCVATGNTAGSNWSCTLDGLTGTSTFMISVSAIALDDTPDVPVLLDDPSGPLFGEAAGIDNIVPLEVLTSTLTLSKTVIGTPEPGGNVTFRITATCDGASDVDCANVTISDTLSGDLAAVQAVSTTGSCSGLDPLPDTTLPDTLNCSLGTITLGTSSIVDITVTLPDDATIDISNTVTGTQTSGPNPAPAQTSVSVTPEEGVLAPGLYHVDPFGNLMVEAVDDPDDELPYDYIADRDDENNVIGYDHMVCLVTDGQFLPFNYNAYSISPPTVPSAVNPFAWRIDNVIGGGSATVNGQFVLPGFFEEFDNGTGVDELGLPCVSWYSTASGEQNVTIVFYNGNVIADWADGYDDAGNAPDVAPSEAGLTTGSHSPLVKEWNVLESTAITERGETSPNLDGTTLTSNITLNAAEGEYEGVTVELDEHVFGSHQSVGGTVGPILVDGAEVTFTVSGTCGMVTVDPNGDTTVEGAAALAADPSFEGFVGTADDPVTVTSAGVPINFNVDTDGCTSANSSSTTVTISADYPNLIGSVQPEIDDEVITVDWVSASTAKQVFLAWAGQRVVLEHNWALNGFCSEENGVDDEIELIREGHPVTYVKGSGPGNFLEDDGVLINGSDQAWTTIDPETCVSQVIYESEDPGQVDVEAFVEGYAASKVAFVVYYMKIETIDVSLVTSVEKPSHNATGHDFAPGNPWDASADATSAESNVSADLLVRARVKGWFTNSNPSGRERDASNPLNVLPADRWVMPDDWALLQGGGGGIDFRPEYDYMISPEGEAFDCDTPTGPCDDIDSGSPPADGEVWEVGFPVAGPYSLLDYFGDATDAPSVLLDDDDNVLNYNYLLRDGVLDWWDAPMPPALVTFDIRGAGFIKEVMKEDVYYTGTPDGDYDDQDFPNPVYATHIPSHDIINDAAGGGYEWDTWGTDGPYVFWNAVLVGENRSGNAGETLTAAQKAELDAIADVYGDDSISRRLAVYSDNHGEAMVIANGDFNLDYDGCQTNTFGGGYECEQDDVVGSSNISAVADYPDFYGKHFPVVSNTATVDWTWGGYKETRVYPGETDQFVYVVFHALDRDGFCKVLPDEDTVSLHPVYSDLDDDYTMPGNDPVESVDFAIDSDEGGIFTNTSSGTGAISVTREFADGLPTYSTEDAGRSETATDHNRSFAPLTDAADECQAWVKVSNSLLGITNILVLAHDDEGDIGFDEIVDFDTTVTYTLNFRWSLITWMGADGISPSDALSGEGDNAGGTDILDEVTAVYGWEAESQEWLAFFPDGVDIPGANDLTGLENGAAYWIAIKGPESIQWEVVTSVN